MILNGDLDGARVARIATSSARTSLRGTPDNNLDEQNRATVMVDLAKVSPRW
jgi:hypothetical protein